MQPIPTGSLKPIARPAEQDFTYVAEPEPDLTCSICLEVFDRPVLHSACGNLFCPKCVEPLTACPICRGGALRDQLVPAPKIVLKQLAGLAVRCKKCGVETTREAIREHLATHAPPVAKAGTPAEIATLMKRIETLEARLRDLEGRSSAPSNPVPSATSPSTVRLDGIYLRSCTQRHPNVKSIFPVQFLLFSADSVVDNNKSSRSYVVTNNTLVIKRLPSEMPRPEDAIPSLPRYQSQLQEALSKGYEAMSYEPRCFFFTIQNNGDTLRFNHETTQYVFAPAVAPIIGSKIRLSKVFTFVDKDTVEEGDPVERTNISNVQFERLVRKRVPWSMARKESQILVTINSAVAKSDRLQLYSYGSFFLSLDSHSIVHADM